MSFTPHEFPELYRSIILGAPGTVSPGTVTLSGHDRTKNWDIQSAKGQTGATTKLNGDDVAQFQATFYLAPDSYDSSGQDDLTRWEAFQRLVESTTSGPTPVALPVFHPDLARNGITEVVNGGVGGLVWDDRGGATVQVKFLEYKPPKPKPASSATSRNTTEPATRYGVGVGDDDIDPNANAKRELEELLAQASAP